ncbi:MAG: DUF305 domain-containing protein [Candidatus Peribacteraceae bacterium]
MALLHFLAMYALMYAMVDRFSNVYLNLNTFYMAGLMTTPMLILEGLLMGAMYHNTKALVAVMAAGAVLFVAFFVFIRQQTAIRDRAFLRSMIPHHAGAILMCEKASLEDAEIRNLCGSIVQSQQSEIDQMKGILRRLAE